MILSLLLAAAAAGPPGGALGAAAEELAARAIGGAEPGRVALAVLAPGAPGLRQPAETALAGALGRRGQAVLILRGAQLADAEGAARALEADLLLRVHVALSGEALTLAGELVPTRPNFFLQGAPAARPAGSRLLAVTAPADGAARALGAGGPGRGRLSLAPLGRLAVRVLALAAGALGPGGAPRLVAVTTGSVLLLDPRGEQLASYPLPPAPEGPGPRDPGATAASLGGGRVGYALAGRPGGEVLAVAGDRLERVASLPAVPLAAGGAGTLYGAFAPGRGVLADALDPDPEPVPRPRSDRELFGVAAAPRPGRVAFAALGTDFVLRLLGPRLAPAGPDLPGVGVGFALADLDGDGEPEVVASSALPGASDRVRVLRPGAAAAPVFESAPVEGSLVAGAAADLTGDGRDDAVLAAALPGGGTQLWLLSAGAAETAP